MKTATIRILARDKAYLEKQAKSSNTTPANIISRLVTRQRTREAWKNMGELYQLKDNSPLRDTALLVSGSLNKRSHKTAS
ncbi:MAG: hypothetical protein HC898_08995 [Phycisphaerales bacterium]|nr:hypothetical protein [Phycisphaerales bacterium]